MNSSSDPHSYRLEDLLHEIDDELDITDSSKSGTEPPLTSELFPSETSKTIKLSDGFYLYVNGSETKGLLKYIPSSPPRAPSIKILDLLEWIKDLGYTYGILEKNIQKALTVIHDNPTSEVDVVAAIGREPSPGQPAKVDYWIGNEEFSKTSGTIQARKNDLLMRIAPPLPGIPGIRITGREIEPPPVQPVVIYPGDHVRKTPEGEYYADCAGVVVLKNNVLTVFEQNRDAAVSIAVSADGMQALICIEPPLGKGKLVAEEQIKSLLTEAGVWAHIQTNAIEQAIRLANEKRQPVRNAIVAQGIAPTQGRDATLVWHIHPKMQRDRFIINEDGSVDFYNQNNILTVTEGDHLLTIHPAASGRDGMNVLGETLPSQPGKSITLQAGPNIIQQREGREWFAACTGLYRLHHDILEVQPLFFVKGDVDFSIGNIDFNGDVIIAGNVLDGFEVRAQGAISVIGSVEAAILEAGKCVEVKSGIFGKGKGRITAGKNIVSYFLQNAEVRAGEDVIIGNQILNSRVYARRFVEVRRGKGSLVGGLTVAGFGVKARTIGSDYGTRTEIEVGCDFITLEKMLHHRQKEKSLLAKSELLENVIEQERRKLALSSTEEENQPLMASARQRQESLKRAITHLRAEYQSLAANLHISSNPEITASDMIMSDVYVRIHDARYKFRIPVKSATVSLDEEGHKIEVITRK